MRSPVLGVGDVRNQHPAAGSRACRRSLARDLGRTAQRVGLLARDMDGTPDARCVLEARIGLRKFRRHRGTRLCCERLGRRLLPFCLSAGREPQDSGKGNYRPLVASLSACRGTGPCDRLAERGNPVVRSMAQGRRHRRRGYGSIFRITPSPERITSTGTGTGSQNRPGPRRMSPEPTLPWGPTDGCRGPGRCPGAG